MWRFVHAYHERGDTPVSGFLFGYSDLAADGKSADPAAIDAVMNRWRAVQALAVAILLCVPHGIKGEEAPDSRPPVVFGFTDKDGARVLAEWPEFTPPIDPRTLTTAVCSSNLRVPVAFAAYQAARPGDTGRQVAENFDRAEGSVYRVTQGKLPANATCILVGPRFLATRRIAGVKTAGTGACDAALVRRVVRERLRPVTRCSRLAILEETDHFLLVEFQKKGDDSLAALVLVSPQGLTFSEYPAKCEAGASCWREGDGGAIDARHFHIVAAFHTSTGYELTVAWDGPEGQLTTLIESGVFRERARWYRYWVR